MIVNLRNIRQQDHVAKNSQCRIDEDFSPRQFRYQRLADRIVEFKVASGEPQRGNLSATHLDGAKGTAVQGNRSAEPQCHPP